MNIIVITTTDGLFMGVVCNESQLLIWAEHYQAKNGYVGSIYIYDNIDCMSIGTQNFKLLYQSL